MDEKELLRKAFKYGEVPGIITYCFTELCPMKKQLYPLSRLALQERRHQSGAMLSSPNALKDGKCEFFAPLRIVKNGLGNSTSSLPR